MKRAKILTLAAFLSFFLILLFPFLSYAEETTATRETPFVDLTRRVDTDLRLFAPREETTAIRETPFVDLTRRVDTDLRLFAPRERETEDGLFVSRAQEPERQVAPRPSLITSYNANETASKAVARNISLFSTRIKEKFSLWLSRSGQYLDMMKDILKKKDVPEDIVFISLIESGFNPNAYSIARAVGPWQFIASTARRYGLEINWWKDERRDPIKSTEAAADYLKDLYEMFGSWNLAMAAYNAGEGRILKAIKRSKADTYWELVGTRHIKNETKEYVPKFIAAGLIATNPKDFGFDDIEYHEPLSYDEVELDSPVDLSVAAECAGTELEVIKKLNPELRRWCTPPDVANYKLRIPKGTKEAFIEKLDSVAEGERLTIEHYTVKKGDTFRKIARKTGFPVAVILSLNSMERIMPLKAGSKLYIPPRALYTADRDDKAKARKASYRYRHGHKKRRPSSKKASRHHKNNLIAAR